MTTSKRGNSIGASVPPGMFTVSQFAQQVGVSADTIRRWVEEGTLTPADTQQRGQLTVRLFSRRQASQVRRRLRDNARQGGTVTKRVA